jgi:hypothetical protein
MAMFIPPESPDPAGATGEVCIDTIATRSNFTAMQSLYWLVLPDG